MTVRDRVVNFLEAHPKSTRAEIEEGTRLKAKKVQSCVFGLARRGVLKSKMTNKKAENGRKMAAFSVIGLKFIPKTKRAVIKAAIGKKLIIIPKKELIITPANTFSNTLGDDNCNVWTAHWALSDRSTTVGISSETNQKIFNILSLYTSKDKAVTIQEFVGKAVDCYIEKIKENIRTKAPL